MAQQLGDAAPLVQPRVEATTIWFLDEAAPAGEFAMSMSCFATRSFKFSRSSRGRARDVVEQEHAARSTRTTFDIADIATLQSAAACRGTLRHMLAKLPQLQSMPLTEEEWDAVVPGDLVPEIVGAAHRSNGFTFSFAMEAHRLVVQDGQDLLMACKEKLASTAPGEKKECTICFDGLEQESAVELPSCEHVFHRRCITKWLSTARTCPICRDDVWLSSLPEFRELSSTGELA
ncbi:unnamed protein product [Alopecurus aequalis]